VKKDKDKLREILELRKGTKDEILQQSELLKTVLESLTHPFYVINANNYKVEIANPAAQLSNAEGAATCYALTHKSSEPCDTKGHPCPLEIIKKTKKPVTVEHTHYDKGGRLRNVEVHGFPVFDNKGNVVWVIEYCLDITDRKRGEEALKWAEKELTIRNKIVEIFLTIPDEEMFGEVLQVILKAMESEYGIFGYIDEHSVLIIPSMTRDIWEKCQVPDKTILFPREKWGGIWGKALIEQRSLFANKGLRVPEGHIPITRVLVVPIMYAGQVIGVLEVANKSTDYSHKDRKFLETIAGKIAPILNARLQRDKQEKERKQTEKALRKARRELEQKVKERTSELQKTNVQLHQKIKVLKRTEEALRESEVLLREREYSLLEAQRIAHLGNWDWDILTNRLFWSDEIYRIFGLQPQEFGATYEAFLESVHPDDRESVKLAVNESLADSNKNYSFEHRVIQPDGSERIVYEQGEVKFDRNGKAVRMIGTVHDITERKQAEQALHKSESALRKSQDRLRFLAGKLMSVQEEERRLLAREMHDDLTQRLALLAIETGKLEQQLKSQPQQFQDKIGQVKDQIIKLSADVHNISRQLHPSIINDLGLVDAIKSECASFSNREEIKIKYESINIPDAIPNDIALCIYRIMQESLRNIAKHAKVKRAEVSLVGRDNGIHLCIRDNGVGFDRAAVYSKGGLGLASMEERVRLIQGELSIQSRPGEGTVVELWVPLSGKSK
jgi:PAS domain S-box-containing protein